MPLSRVRRVIGIALGAIALLGTSLVVGTTAQAQVRYRGGHIGPSRTIVVRPRPRVRVFVGPRFNTFGWPGYYWPGYYPYYPETATDRYYASQEYGYHDGFERGKDDAKDGKPSNPESHKHFSGSSNETYRNSFLRGYADGYRQYAG